MLHLAGDDFLDRRGQGSRVLAGEVGGYVAFGSVGRKLGLAGSGIGAGSGAETRKREGGGGNGKDSCDVHRKLLWT